MQGPATLEKIRAAKILVVGAGGIGCELLKNLVLTGFQSIEVIDLDTIDVSNLNRQFLFRPQHVGRPKAHVAKEAVLALNPAAHILSYHANIKDAEFGMTYFSKFDLVINALDNVSARKHVNRLCLATDKPLIEAGTQGYLGQANVIRKGVTECFECTPQAAQKKFPICTIRSTPDKPVHCVVWAKEFHKLLFGDSKSSYLFEDQHIGAQADTEEEASARKSGSTYMPCIDEMKELQHSEGAVEAWARRFFDAIFHDEIARRLESAPETYKTAVHKPKPVSLAAVENGDLISESTASPGALKDQRVLSLLESSHLLIDTIKKFYQDDSTRNSIGSLEFSKDSALDLDLVTAATNLRAYTFGIPMQSRFDVKSIAGNIIPAIATTNAIVAGLQVMEAVKIIQGLDIKESCSFTWISRSYCAGNRLLLATKHNPPGSNCYVCGKRVLTLFIDTSSTTLRDFIDKVLKGVLSFNTPNIDNNDSFNFLEDRFVIKYFRTLLVWQECYWKSCREEDEDDEEYAQKLTFLQVPMRDLVGGGLKHETRAEINDFSQDLSLSLQIVHRAKADFDELKHPQFFEIVGEVDAAAFAKQLDAERDGAKKASENSASATAPAAGQKRSRGARDVVDETGGLDEEDGVILVDEEDKTDSGHSAAPKKARIDDIPAAGSALEIEVE